jgi:hypothetical protein
MIIDDDEDGRRALAKLLARADWSLRPQMAIPSGSLSAPAGGNFM